MLTNTFRQGLCLALTLTLMALPLGADEPERAPEAAQGFDFGLDVPAMGAAPANYLTGSATGDIIMGNTAFWGTFSALGLSFATQGILGGSENHGPWNQFLGSSLSELGTLPLALSGSPDALGLAVFGGALLAAETLSNMEYGMYSDPSNIFYWGRTSVAMYRAYDAYASYRLQSPAWDNTNFTRYSFMELAAAPFNPENIFTTNTLLSIISCVGGMAIWEWLLPDSYTATVWQTGETWRGERQVGTAGFIFESAFTPFINNTLGAIGEEVVFRGYIHEELTLRMGEPWASIIGSATFSLMHIITDVARGLPLEIVIFHAIDTVIGNLIWNQAYNTGGLPLAVASHAWGNIMANFFMSFIRGGAPASRGGY